MGVDQEIDPEPKTGNQLDEALVRRRLSRAGWPPAESRTIYEEAARRLFDSLQQVRISPTLVLDCSAVAASLASHLGKHFADARIVSVDEAHRPLTGRHGRQPRWRLWRARRDVVCAGFAALPLPDRAAELLTSNLSLHRYLEPDRVLAEFHRVLAEGGLLMVATFGPDTLAELRDCWRTVDADEHVHPFADMHDIGDALLRGGFQDVVMSSERLTCHFPDLETLHQDLRRLGVGNASRRRSRSLRTPSQLARVNSAYELLRVAEGVPVTLELIYAHAWKVPARVSSVPVSLT